MNILKWSKYCQSSSPSSLFFLNIMSWKHVRIWTLVRGLEVGETLFPRYCLILVGVRRGLWARGGVALIQGPIRERMRGILCPTSPNNLLVFITNTLHVLICLYKLCVCVCTYKYKYAFMPVCVRVQIMPGYTCVCLWRHRHNQSLIGSTRCISEA